MRVGVRPRSDRSHLPCALRYTEPRGRKLLSQLNGANNAHYATHFNLFGDALSTERPRSHFQVFFPRMFLFLRVLSELRSSRLWREEHNGFHSSSPDVGNRDLRPWQLRVFSRPPLGPPSGHPSSDLRWYWTLVYPTRGKRADGFHGRLIVDLVQRNPQAGNLQPNGTTSIGISSIIFSNIAVGGQNNGFVIVNASGYNQLTGFNLFVRYQSGTGNSAIYSVGYTCP